MFEIKTIMVKNRRTGRRKPRYYAEVRLCSGKKIPLILGSCQPDCCRR